VQLFAMKDFESGILSVAPPIVLLVAISVHVQADVAQEAIGQPGPLEVII
jgi:hypothetical protein